VDWLGGDVGQVWVGEEDSDEVGHLLQPAQGADRFGLEVFGAGCGPSSGPSRTARRTTGRPCG
jgi:hypothetical protein